MIDLAFSEAAFASLAPEYESRKKLAEQLVVEWKWASWKVHSLEPLYLERCGYAPGRILKKKPECTDNRVEYGFDQAGRIAVERQHRQFGFYETFQKHSDTIIESAHYDYGTGNKPIKITFVTVEDDKAVRSVSSAVNGCCIEEYTWTNSLLTTVVQFTAERVGNETPVLLRNYVAECEYDDSGRLQRIKRSFYDPDDQSTIISVTTPFERVGKRIRRKLYG